MNISSKILKYSYLFIIIVITLTFIYKTFIYDSKYEPYILKKLSHPEKNIYVNLSNDNIYTDEFKNVFNDISNKVTLPKDLYISDSFKIFFNNQGLLLQLMAYYMERMNVVVQIVFILTITIIKQRLFL